MTSAAPAVERVTPPKGPFVVVNAIMRTLLTSPLHRLAGGGRIVLLTYTGRKSGATYRTPVGVHEVDGHLVTLTSSGWRVNFRTPGPVTLRRNGADIHTTATLVEDPDRVAEAYQTLIDRVGYAKAGRQLGIRINVDRSPTHEELVDAVHRSGLSVVSYDAPA